MTILYVYVYCKEMVQDFLILYEKKPEYANICRIAKDRLQVFLWGYYEQTSISEIRPSETYHNRPILFCTHIQL